MVRRSLRMGANRIRDQIIKKPRLQLADGAFSQSFLISRAG
jgi:hypothetical protein